MQGTTPELSINLADVISFIQNINSMLKNDITAGAAQLKEQLSKFTSNFKKALKTRYNTFIDKMEYCLNYPDAIINSVLSKFFNTDVNIRFRFIELLREKANVKFDLSKLKVDVDGNGSMKTQAARNFKKTSNAGDVVAVVITEIFVCLDLQKILSDLEIDFVCSDLFDYLQKKVDIYRKAFDDGAVKYWTSQNKTASYITGWLSNIGGLFDKLLSKKISISIAATTYITSIIDDTSGRYITPFGALFMVLFDVAINGIMDFSNTIVSLLATPFFGFLTGVLLDGFVDELGTRDKAEFYAYNWYYFFLLLANKRKN